MEKKIEKYIMLCFFAIVFIYEVYNTIYDPAEAAFGVPVMFILCLIDGVRAMIKKEDTWKWEIGLAGVYLILLCILIIKR